MNKLAGDADKIDYVVRHRRNNRISGKAPVRVTVQEAILVNSHLEFLIMFFGASIDFLYRLGLEVEFFEKIFATALVVLAFNYILHYIRLALPTYYFSATPWEAGLVTYDPWRGYRLKPSSFALFTLSIYAPFMLIISKGFVKKMAWFIVILLLGWIWALVQARSMAAFLILSSMMFPFFFAESDDLFYKPEPIIFHLLSSNPVD